MKNLRKALSLALVVALSLSLVIVAGAKTLDEYTDKDSIGKEYLEAVELLSALGVFEGDENGALNPQGTFTRAQAAKIVTYITIGASAANMAQASTEFSDVPATHWASGYVAFATQRNIINGVGSGKFDPDSPVTGAQLSKLLLVAIGYGAKGEYVGTSWEFNSIVDGQRFFILEGDVDHSTPATREQSIQYVFNALTTQIVSYNQLFDAYLNASTSEFVTTKRTNLAAETFGAAKITVLDDFGYAQHYWRQSKPGYTRDITGEYVTDDILGSFVSSPMVSKSSLYADYQWDSDRTVVKYNTDGSAAQDVYGNLVYEYHQDRIDTFVNGYPVFKKSSDFAAKGDAFTAAINTALVGELDPTLVAPLNGVKVDLIDTDENGKIDKVVATYEYLAKVTAVNAAGGTVNISLIDVFEQNVTFTNVAVDETYAKNDYVVVIPENSNINEYNYTTQYDLVDTNKITGRTGTAKILSVKKADVISAAPSSFTRATGMGLQPINTITVNGEMKWVSAVQYLEKDPTKTIMFVDGTFYLDSNGSIVGYDVSFVSPATLQYMYILAAEHGAFGTPRIAATLAVDGARVVYELALKSDGKTPAGAKPWLDDTNASSVSMGWYSYRLDANGKAILNTLGDSAVTNPVPNPEKLAFAAPINEVGNTAVTLVTASTPTQPGIAMLANYYNGTNVGLPLGGYTANSSTKLYVNGRLYTGYASFIRVIGGTNTQAMFILTPKIDNTPSNTIAVVYVITSDVISGEYGIVTGVGFRGTTADGTYWAVRSVATPAGEELLYTGNRVDTGSVVPIVTSSDGVRSIGDPDDSKTKGDTMGLPLVSGIDVDANGNGYIYFADGDLQQGNPQPQYYRVTSDTVFFNYNIFGEAVTPAIGDGALVYAAADGTLDYASAPTAYAVAFVGS